MIGVAIRCSFLLVHICMWISILEKAIPTIITTLFSLLVVGGIAQLFRLYKFKEVENPHTSLSQRFDAFENRIKDIETNFLSKLSTLSSSINSLSDSINNFNFVLVNKKISDLESDVSEIHDHIDDINRNRVRIATQLEELKEKVSDLSKETRSNLKDVDREIKNLTIMVMSKND